MLHDPLAHLVGVDAVSQRHRRDRHAGRAALLNDLELILAREGTPSGAIDAHAKWRVRFGVRDLHGGHHLRRQASAAQEGPDRTVTLRRQANDLKPALPVPTATVRESEEVERFRPALT